MKPERDPKESQPSMTMKKTAERQINFPRFSLRQRSAKSRLEKKERNEERKSILLTEKQNRFLARKVNE